MAQGPNATYQATRSLALWLWRRIFKGFYHIWAWQPSWSCDPDPANKLSFPHPIKAPSEIWLQLAQQLWRRRSLKMVDWQQTDRPWLYQKLTNEPKGSGELKKFCQNTCNKTAIGLLRQMQILEPLQYQLSVFYRFTVVNKCNKSWKFE